MRFLSDTVRITRVKTITDTLVRVDSVLQENTAKIDFANDKANKAEITAQKQQSKAHGYMVAFAVTLALLVAIIIVIAIRLSI